MRIEWPTGGLWDADTIVIEPRDMSRLLAESLGWISGAPPCPHAHDVTVQPWRDGPHDVERQTWHIRHVVIGVTEAGHATTGVCAECVVDAMNSLTDG